MADYSMTQMVMDPTTVTENSSTQIDLLFTTLPEEFQHVGCDDLGLSDHIVSFMGS